MPALHGMDVFQHLAGGQGQISIFETCRLQCGCDLTAGIRSAAWVHAVIQALALGLTGKTICHGFNGIGLVALFFEFEFHSLFF